MSPRVGIVIPPRYFDTSTQELQALSPGIEVLHTQMRFDRSFGYTLDEMPATAGEIEQCAIALADAGADVVVQVGMPFSWMHGWHRATQIQQSISDRIGAPFEMMGLAPTTGVMALGTTRVAVASAYYPLEWTERYCAFLIEAGLDIVGTQDFFGQGLVADREAAWAQSFIGFEPGLVIDSVVKVGESFPEAEAIIVPGKPGTFIHLLADAEAAIDRPIVSYHALWWQCLSHLGLTPARPSGRLLAL